MNIHLSKPFNSDWNLVATDATAEQIEAFDAAVEHAIARSVDDGWCDKQDSVDTASVWELRVTAYLAIRLAFEVGKQMNVTVGIANIGESEFEPPEPLRK